MALITLCLVVVAVLQVICLLALVDQYKSLLQVRNALLLVDTPQELPLLGLDGVRPSAVGLPARLDSEEFAIVVLLSNKCGTCTAVARGFGRFPAPGWAVVAAASEDQCRVFQEEVGLHGDRVLLDVGGRIADRLKVHSFPTAIVFSNGAAVNSRAIPSNRQLRRLLEDRNQLLSLVN